MDFAGGEWSVCAREPALASIIVVEESKLSSSGRDRQMWEFGWAEVGVRDGRVLLVAIRRLSSSFSNHAPFVFSK